MKLIFQKDQYNMNWFRQDFAYAKVTCPKGIEADVTNRREGDLLYTEICLKNITDKAIFTSLTDIGIYFPVEDKYESSEVCMKERCNTHIFCGEDISYLMALRMGGEAPHLGMILTEGSLGGYSIERDIAKMSNDRGCFILHPMPMELAPGEESRICWTVFPHQGKDDFEEKISSMRRFVKAEASQYVLFPEEECTLTVKTSFPAEYISVKLEGKELCGKVEQSEGAGQWKSSAEISLSFPEPGEKVFHINADGISTFCRILVQESWEKLAAKRFAFITGKQQYHGKEKQLSGAYLIYDNEEKHLFYTAENDFNAGRERVGMGVALAAYLQSREDTEKDAALEQSLQEYADFVLRELVDAETGEVYNDCGRDGSYERLYNFPWFATFFAELYRLYGEKKYLTCACNVVRRFYEKGGCVHYSIEMPVLTLCSALEQGGMEAERNEMEALFRKHGDSLAEIGFDYPASEVNYEQSIVAPAADILLQLAILTGEEKYLEAGKVQMKVLELFNGRQPDYHLYETAVRHWDGYWFGKNRMYGDTFPHYWSGLTGVCYLHLYRITGEEDYRERAESSLRSALTLILPDGRGSCAYVFPKMVNGVKADCYDPYANDQDWALYFYLRKERDLRREFYGGK